VRWMCVFVSSILLSIASLALAQSPKSNRKPTEKLVVEWERLVASGAFLTPDGWNAAGKLYKQANAFPATGEISLISTGGLVGEDWLRDGSAEVETKWDDYFGTIDSSLRYKAPPVPVVMWGGFFRLVYTNKHVETGKRGEVISEVTGPWDWKIEQPEMSRWSTVDKALEYVTMMREKTDNPVIRKNADETIVALKRLRPCRNASAC
jgi:hypothetical protein